MGCIDSFSAYHRSCHLSRLLLYFLILSSTQLRFKAEGRPQTKPLALPKPEKEDKAIRRGQIGSSPPRCERKCSSCGHCEAIQVPTNPQDRNEIKHSSSSSSPISINLDYARGDDNSNYKPMSWKCKCGNFIFNP